MVSFEVPDPVMEVGLKLNVNPLPPEAERLIAESNPPVAVAVTVTEVEPLWVTDVEVGEAEIEKPAVVFETLTERVVVDVTPPPVPLMVTLYVPV